jgi:hypothetical protein
VANDSKQDQTDAFIDGRKMGHANAQTEWITEQAYAGLYALELTGAIDEATFYENLDRIGKWHDSQIQTPDTEEGFKGMAAGERDFEQEKATLEFAADIALGVATGGIGNLEKLAAKEGVKAVAKKVAKDRLKAEAKKRVKENLWKQARRAYWKKYGKNGEAPRRQVLVRDKKTGQKYKRWETKELHHKDPQRNDGSNEPDNLKEVWPTEHAELDPHRHTSYEVIKVLKED